MATGCFTILSSAVGYFGSQFRPVFLSIYLIAGTFTTTLQLMLVLGIFAAQERVADEIEKADSISGVKHFDKWVLPLLMSTTCLLESHGCCLDVAHAFVLVRVHHSVLVYLCFCQPFSDNIDTATRLAIGKGRISAQGPAAQGVLD